MSIVIINPNSTASMTDAMVRAARIAAPGLAFEGWTSCEGPPAIQGAEDGVAATPPLLKLVEQASRQGADGIIIGCFDDTALETVVQIADCPVVGLGQASYAYAHLRGWRFSVVTTLAVSVPVLEANIRRFGFEPGLARVRASEVAVLALEADPLAAGQAIRGEALRAQAEDGIAAVILGCAGMVQVVEDVRNSMSIQVIDPVSCAARCMKWLADGQG